MILFIITISPGQNIFRGTSFCLLRLCPVEAGNGGMVQGLLGHKSGQWALTSSGPMQLTAVTFSEQGQPQLGHPRLRQSPLRSILGKEID